MVSLTLLRKEQFLLNWMLSVHRNKQSAKRFFKKLFSNQHATNPRVINVDKSPTLTPALSELQAENEAPKKTKLRAAKYLNNSMENDHKFTSLSPDIDNGINRFRRQKIHA